MRMRTSASFDRISRMPGSVRTRLHCYSVCERADKWNRLQHKFSLITVSMWRGCGTDWRCSLMRLVVVWVDDVVVCPNVSTGTGRRCEIVCAVCRMDGGVYNRFRCDISKHSIHSTRTRSIPCCIAVARAWHAVAEENNSYMIIRAGMSVLFVQCNYKIDLQRLPISQQNQPCVYGIQQKHETRCGCSRHAGTHCLTPSPGHPAADVRTHSGFASDSVCFDQAACFLCGYILVFSIALQQHWQLHTRAYHSLRPRTVIIFCQPASEFNFP